jgi:D-alanyl-D-alanine dipeptidase
VAEVILMSDARVAAVPLRERGDPLADTRSSSVLLVDKRKQDSLGAFAHLRQEVVNRLEAAARLLLRGTRLLVIEGYRPPELQRRYFESYLARLQGLHPSWNDDELRVAASYVSPVDVAPHPAGAAVDLTLCTADGVELDLGTPVNASPEDSAGACYTATGNISSTARSNRGCLAAALSAVGLVNYPTEWWHWSYGDRYWALSTGSDSAIFGPVEL